MAESNTPIAVFLSGGGRTLANLIQHRDEHGLPIDIAVVISSRQDVRGVDIAREAGIDTRIVRRADHPSAEAYRHAMFDPVRQSAARWVVMAGFLSHVLIPDDFAGRVLNIHPSLLPAFGGPGMYGMRVHRAVIAKGCKISGCTVHLVDNVYDNGPILHQLPCPVQPEDTAETLAGRVFQLECRALPQAIRQLLNDGR